MDGKQGQRFLILVFLVILTSSVLAQGLMKPLAQEPEYQAIQIPANIAIPVIDGNLDDAIWAKAAPDSLLQGGEPNKWNRDWADFADNLVIWKAVWSDETNRLYVAVEVRDDIRGTFDNTNYMDDVYLYRPYEDDSIEFFVDPDKSGGNYFPFYDSAQQWRISGQGLVNLANYSHDGSQLYDGSDFIGAVQAGTNGNWTCEAQFVLYDNMYDPSTIKNLVEGIEIGWDIWYNDSDDENYTVDNFFKRDQQTGWYYAGKAFENANFFATMTLKGLPTIANFGVTRREIAAGSQITFSDSSNGDVTEWYWNFEGGEPEVAIGNWDQTVTYNTPGSYDVTLIVNGSFGADTLVKADYITVHPLPVANFAANVTTGGRDLNVIFTNLSQNIGDNPSWQWEFPGGLPNTQNGPGPHTITYPEIGQFDVTLILTNSWGADTLTKVDYIQILPPPTAAFTQSGNAGSAPLDIVFTDASVGEITNWHWEFQGGLPETADTQGPIQVNYTTTGLYSVELQVSGPGGADTLRLDNNIQVYGPPEADFTADKTVGSAPLSVEFTDNSTGGVTNWSWEFPGGDPATANTSGPHIVTYNAIGTYSVTLTIEGPGGINTETKTNFITVIAPPVAKFGAEPRTGIAPLMVTFTDSSTGDIDSYEWEFLGGQPATASGIGPHQITYNTAGVWSAKLTVTGPGGTDILPVNNYIEVLPKTVANFTANPQRGTTPLDVIFTSTATGNLDSWEWTFEGGEPATISGEGPHTVRYNTAGEYDVELIVTGEADADTRRWENCITVSNPTDPPVANFEADTTRGPIPLTVKFTSLATGGVENWFWNFEGGTPATADSVGPHTVVYENIGEFDVQLIVSNTTDANTLLRENYISAIEPIPAPTANFDADVTSGTAPLTVNFSSTSTGEIDSLLWSFPGGTPATATTKTAAIVYNTPDDYAVELIVTGPGGANTLRQDDFIRVTESSERPTANFETETTIGPAPLTTKFRSTSTGEITSWLWTFTGGTPETATADTATVIYNTPENYPVQLIVTGPGGADTLRQEDYITVTDPTGAPVANFGADPVNGGPGLEVTFTDSSQGNISEWSWTFQGGQPSLSNRKGPIVVSYDNPGQYPVSLLVSADNIKFDYIIKEDLIEIFAAPTADFSVAPATGQAPLSVTFTSESTGEVTNWEWQFPGGNPESVVGQSTTIVEYAAPGSYSATLTVTGPGGEDEITKVNSVQISGYSYPEIAHSAPGGQITPGNAVAISAQIQDTDGIESAYLLYSQSGNANFDSTEMQSGDGLNYTGEIPASAVTERGVIYYLKATDVTGVIGYDYPGSFNHCYALQTRIAEKSSPYSQLGNKYRIISVPMQLDETSPGSVLIDDLGSYDPKKWRLFRHQNNQYVEYSVGNIDAITPGRSFWLITSTTQQIDAENGRSLPGNASYSISLQPGWNMIGNPFLFPVSWNDADYDPALVEPPWHYSNGFQANQTTLQPWDGYIVYNQSTSATQLQLFPQEPGATFAKPSLFGDNLNGWMLQLKATTSDYADIDNYCGVLATAPNVLSNLHEPPPIGNAVSLYFTEERKTEPLASLFYTTSRENYQWDMTVAVTKSQEPVKISLTGLASLPADWQVRLVDRTTSKSVILTTMNNYQYVPLTENEKRHFTVQAFAATDVPDDGIRQTDSFELLPNFPNPFNGGTLINYSLPTEAEVTVQIFNILGNEIATLQAGNHQPAGLHAIHWNGRDQFGRTAPAGVYMVRITANAAVQMRKIMMVK